MSTSHSFEGDPPLGWAWAFAKARGRGRGRPGPFGGHPFGGGRARARRGDVRIALLLLLAEEPRNGYQLMQTIEERSGGRWRPSPGSVYPTLAQLEDEGLIRSTEPNGTKLFEITEAGRAEVEGRKDLTPPWLVEEDDGSVSDLKHQLKQFHVAVMQVLHAGDERQIARVTQTLADAKRAVYRILAEEDGD
jgi:DNA-binding PadR family transcriptional regulator